MRESPDLFLTPVTSEAWIADLNAAGSITLIIHGVGNATNEGLLRAAADGYTSSGLRGSSRRTTLSDCPNLSGGKGAESLVLETSGGTHFVVALPWVQRRTRLSAVAKWSAMLLLALTALITLTFLFRGPLEWLDQWLRSWRHQFVAYGVMAGFSLVIYLVRPNPTNRE